MNSGAKPTSFRVPQAAPERISERASPWFWNPGRIGVETGPDWFTTRLKALDPDLAVTWNRETERWQVWVRKPRLQSKLCQGWLLLFPVTYRDGSYCPLDERVFAKLHHVSAETWGSAREYFTRVTQEIERDRARRAATRHDEIAQIAGDYWKHLHPSVGYGRSNGSKSMNFNGL